MLTAARTTPKVRAKSLPDGRPMTGASSRTNHIAQRQGDGLHRAQSDVRVAAVGVTANVAR